MEVERPPERHRHILRQPRRLVAPVRPASDRFEHGNLIDLLEDEPILLCDWRGAPEHDERGAIRPSVRDPGHQVGHPWARGRHTDCRPPAKASVGGCHHRGRLLVPYVDHADTGGLAFVGAVNGRAAHQEEDGLDTELPKRSRHDLVTGHRVVSGAPGSAHRSHRSRPEITQAFALSRLVPTRTGCCVTRPASTIADRSRIARRRFFAARVAALTATRAGNASRQCGRARSSPSQPTNRSVEKPTTGHAGRQAGAVTRPNRIGSRRSPFPMSP